MGKLTNIIVVIFAVLLLSLMFFNLVNSHASITGYTSVPYNSESLNLEINADSSYDLGFIEYPLNSLSINGHAEGRANVYIENDAGARYLVFKIEKQGVNMLTGLFMKENGFGAEFNGCVETCILPKNFNPSYRLIVELDSGASLIIDEILYK